MCLCFIFQKLKTLDVEVNELHYNLTGENPLHKMCYFPEKKYYQVSLSVSYTTYLHSYEPFQGNIKMASIFMGLKSDAIPPNV